MIGASEIREWASFGFSAGAIAVTAFMAIKASPHLRSRAELIHERDLAMKSAQDLATVNRALQDGANGFKLALDGVQQEFHQFRNLFLKSIKYIVEITQHYERVASTLAVPKPPPELEAEIEKALQDAEPSSLETK